MTGITRRAFAKGAAWSLPLAAVATATPSASAAEAPNARVSGSCYFFNDAIWVPWWTIEATTDTPVPAGVGIKYSFPPDRPMRLTDVTTSPRWEDTRGLTDIEVDGYVWTAVTTRKITKANPLQLYSLGIGFWEGDLGDPKADHATLEITVKDGVSADNSVTLKHTGPGRCRELAKW